MGYFSEAEPLLNGIRNAAVREAFLHTDRSRFVPIGQKENAWADHPLPIEDGATISQPSLVARMTEWLEPALHYRTLEIGTGSGYQTALLAQLVAEVCTVEISELLSNSAKARLKALGFSNVHFRIGDGAQGWPEMAPFDRIIATVAFPQQPDPLLRQLRDGGICLAPVGGPGETQQLIRYCKTGSATSEEILCAVRFLSMR